MPIVFRVFFAAERFTRVENTTNITWTVWFTKYERNRKISKNSTEIQHWHVWVLHLLNIYLILAFDARAPPQPYYVRVILCAFFFLSKHFSCIIFMRIVKFISVRWKFNGVTCIVFRFRFNKDYVFSFFFFD